MRVCGFVRNLTLLIALTSGLAFAYLTDFGIYGPPADYLSPTVPGRGVSYTDSVFNAGNDASEWIRRISDAASTPGGNGPSGNLTWVSHEYATTSPFNSDNTRVLLIHEGYFAVYDLNGNIIRAVPQVCATCSPRWSRTDPGVFYYVVNRQVLSYNVVNNIHASVGNPLNYDQLITRGEDDICFDGTHLIGFGRRGTRYYMYLFSLPLRRVVSEYRIGTSSDFSNVDSAEIAPNDMVVVSYYANDTQNTRAPKKGIWAFSNTLRPLWQISSTSGHHDVGRDASGAPVLVMTNSNSYHPLPDCQNGIEKINIMQPSNRSCLLSLHWTLAVHVSLSDQSGWAIVSTYAPGDPVHAALSRKEEFFPYLNARDGWSVDANPAHSKGKAKWSENDSASASYLFYGTSVQWLAYKDSASGIAEVTIDGEKTSVDLYSAQPAAQAIAFSKSNLPLGFHWFSIDVTAQKNPSSSGYKVYVDAIEDDTPWKPFTNEIVMVRLDGGEVRRVAHHRSRPLDTYNYQPRAVASRDGSRVLVTSNFGWPVDGYSEYVDAYVMAVNTAAGASLMGGARGGPTTMTTQGNREGRPQPGGGLDFVLTPQQRGLLNEYLYPKVSERRR